jgi:hypothetical protein
VEERYEAINYKLNLEKSQLYAGFFYDSNSTAALIALGETEQ